MKKPASNTKNIVNNIIGVSINLQHPFYNNIIEKKFTLVKQTFSLITRHLLRTLTHVNLP